MKRLLASSVLAFCLSSCGGGDSSGSNGGGSPAPAPSPTPTSAPTPTPVPSPTIAAVSYLHVFGIDVTDGQQPNGPLVQASDGNFYGTTRAGGAYTCSNGLGCGALFRVSSSGQESILKSFGSASSDGSWPEGPLIQGQDGALYGVTAFGGRFGKGTIYKVSLAGAYSVLYSFGESTTDGFTPVGGLAQSSDGSIYGATSSGGLNSCFQVPQFPGEGNCGTIFKLSPEGNFSTVYTFGATASDGVQPNGSLLLASDGNLYGTTVNGGTNHCGGGGETNNCGTVFRLSLTGALTILHSFGPTVDDGIAPQGALIEASNGFLYGTTASGGGGTCGHSYACGTVFRSSTAGALTTLYAFATNGRVDGYYPTPFLVQASDGFLYGTTGSGGSTQSDLAGTAFRLSLTGTKTTLFSFGPVNENPHNPVGGFVQGTDGALYGVLAYNGNYGAVGARSGAGAVFKLIP